MHFCQSLSHNRKEGTMIVFLKRLRSAIMTCIAGAILCQAVWAQKSDDVKKLQEDVDALKTDVKSLAGKQQQILDQLSEIKKLLQAHPAAAQNPDGLQLPDTISVEGNPSQGQDSARVGIIEFTDFQCPYCGRFTMQAYPKIVSDYVATGKIRFIYRDLPLSNMHPFAQPAARAAHCAGEQGKFWEMHNSLFTDQRALQPQDIAGRATKLGLDMTKFNDCVNSSKYSSEIDVSVKAAEKMNINGTPSFVMGTFGDNKNVMKVEKSIVGAYPFEKFQADLDDLLKEQK